ncbi:uncharacterized protein LOC135395883 [Ornithodoros turicata]|uniref:uncharacterized protein LOC135395883 n=1 Tax=Ornithodoros turicata TaxID=34597 RepID=UPI003138CB9E
MDRTVPETSESCDYQRCAGGSSAPLLGVETAQKGPTSRSSDFHLMTAWITYAERPEYLNLPPQQLHNKRLCSQHFEMAHFTNRQRTRLRRSACPTVQRPRSRALDAESHPMPASPTTPAPRSPTPSGSSVGALLGGPSRESHPWPASPTTPAPRSPTPSGSSVGALLGGPSRVLLLWLRSGRSPIHGLQALQHLPHGVRRPLAPPWVLFLVAPRESPIHGLQALQHLPHGVRRPLAPPWVLFLVAPRESPIHGLQALQHLPHGVRRPLAPPWVLFLVAPRESPIHGLQALQHLPHGVRRPLAPPWVLFLVAPRESPIHGLQALQHLPHGVRRPLAPPWVLFLVAPRESPIHGLQALQHPPHGVRRPLAPPWVLFLVAPRESPIHGLQALQHLPHGVRRPLAPPWVLFLVAPRESPIHGLQALQHPPHGVRRPLAPPWVLFLVAPRESPIHGLQALQHLPHGVRRPLAPPWVLFLVAPRESPIHGLQALQHLPHGVRRPLAPPWVLFLVAPRECSFFGYESHPWPASPTTPAPRSPTPSGSSVGALLGGPSRESHPWPASPTTPAQQRATPSSSSVGALMLAGPSTECTPPRPHKGGRPPSKRTPRTVAEIDQLRRTRDSLRRSLFRAQRRASQQGGSLSRTQIIRAASRYLSREALEIFRTMLYLQPLRKFGRRWPPQYRNFALKLHFAGPKAYRFLSRYLLLPTERCLKYWLQEVAMQPGVVPPVLDSLQTRLQGTPLKDRACIIMFDEMSIKQHLQYDRGSDVVYGYADSGTERSPEFAHSALVAVLAGISKNWLQPLSYILSKTTASAETLQTLLFDLIRRLHLAEIFVKAVVCDQGTSNCSLARALEVSPSKPFFVVDESKVYFIFDAPHLMKTTRNLLLRHDLQIGNDEQRVKWSFIKEFYENTHPARVRLAPKLTRDHLYPTVFKRMRVKLATQVLSDSVSTGIACLIFMGAMSPEAAATSKFLQEIDMLFDTLNSSSVVQGDDRKMRYALSATSGHKEVLEAAAVRIAGWKFDCDRQPPTVNGWQVTIGAVLGLWDDLKANFDFDFLLTRRLNQDPLENLFGEFRQIHGCNETPNAFQFVAGMKHALAGRLLKLPGRGNCEADTTTLLNELRRIPVHSISPSAGPSESTTFDSEADTGSEPVLQLPEEPANLIEMNAQYEFAGSLVQSFLSAMKCQNCPNLLKAAEAELDPSTMYSYLREQDPATPTKCMPSKAFFNFYCNIEKKFQSCIGHIVHRRNVMARLLAELGDTVHEPFCSPRCGAKFMRMYCTSRIQLYLRLENQKFTEDHAERRKRKKL